jgi:uncharacterized membrane protein YedE/YeeE
MTRGLLLTLLMFPTSLLAETLPGTDPLAYPGGAWSPYVVGAGIGVLSWLVFYFSDKAIGASSFFATLAGFVSSVIMGAALSAWHGGEFADEWLHPMWVARFGDSVVLRAAVAILGGILMAFGARLGGGCTSGHGISGTMQLNVASWIAVAFMFIGGIGTAMLLYRL